MGALCTARCAMSSVREPPRATSSLLHGDSTRCDRNLRRRSERASNKESDKGMREGGRAGRGRTRKRVYARAPRGAHACV